MSLSAAIAQNAQLQRIANELADELHDRVSCVWLSGCVWLCDVSLIVRGLQEMALVQQRSTKELLANRITELEAEIVRLRGGMKQ